MDKNNKKTTIIIIILIIISIITIYQIFIKKEDYIEIGSNTNILNTKEENNQTEEKTKSKIVIYITGAIKNEGVYELEENSRIDDAIKKAGGLTEEANIEEINLVYKLEDGMKIHIPSKTEKQNNIKDNTETYISKDNTNKEESNKETINKKININKATQAELEKLPGIGASTAQKIIEYRKEKGKFSNIEEIKQVKGIGESKYSKIKDLIET